MRVFPGSLAVEPGQIANRLARLLPKIAAIRFGRSARGDPARRKQQDLAFRTMAPQQCRRDGGGLARPRRRDEDGTGVLLQRCEQVRKDGVNR